MRAFLLAFPLISACFAHATEAREEPVPDGPPCGEGERIAKLQEARRTAVPVLETPCSAGPWAGPAPVLACPTLERHGETVVVSVPLLAGQAPPAVITLYVRRFGTIRDFPLSPARGDAWATAVPVADGEPWEMWLEAYDEAGNGPGMLGTPGNPLRVSFPIAP